MLQLCYSHSSFHAWDIIQVLYTHYLIPKQQYGLDTIINKDFFHIKI